MGERPNGCGARGRLHAVQRRHHRPVARRGAADDRGAGRGRSRTTWPSRGASRTGSSSRTPSGTRARPASGRRSGWRRCRATWISATPLDAVARALGDRARGPGSTGQATDDLRLRVRLQARRRVARRRRPTRVLRGEVHRRIALSDPGIDDYRNELLWSPTTPTLIEAELRAARRRGEMLDSVLSYTALRSIGVQGDRFVLNGRPYPLRMVLDQGYWPETGARRRTTTRCAATSSWPRRWGSTACASTRRSRTRGTCTGPTCWACWCGKRCPAPTASPSERSSG